MVSEREIEAAREAWREYWSDVIGQYEDNKGPMEGMRRALEAAARVREEANAGEPVVGVSLSDLNEWRAEWMDANDPQDGTDCVTPFDKYLYTRPTEAWQPIETAPKDGTDILGWHEIAGTSQTCFSKGEWVCPDWDEDRYIHCTWSPTHWMPLPTPPTAGGGDE